MNREEVEQKFTELLQGFIPEDVNWEVNLDEKLANMTMINSLTFIKFIVLIEEEYELEFDDNELQVKAYDSFRSILEKVYEKIEI